MPPFVHVRNRPDLYYYQMPQTNTCKDKFRLASTGPPSSLPLVILILASLVNWKYYAKHQRRRKNKDFDALLVPFLHIWL